MQKNYEYAGKKGIAGGKFDLTFDEVNSRACEDELNFGLAVMVGTLEGVQVKLPTSGTTKDKIEGVVLYGANTEQDKDGNIVLAKGTTVSVMKKGKIWVRIATAANVTAGKSAYVVLNGEDAGKFTDDQSGNLDIGAVFGGEKDKEIAVVELR